MHEASLLQRFSTWQSNESELSIVKAKIGAFYIYEPIVLNCDNKFIIDLRRQAFSCDRQDSRLWLVDWEFIWVGPVMYFICRKI